MTDSSSLTVSLRDDNAPIDKKNLVYLGMLILGTGVLFPYNACMAASDYYDKTWPGKDLAFYAPLAISAASPIVQFLMVQVAKHFSYSIRIVPSFIAYSFLILLIPVSVIITSNATSFYVVLALFLFIGFINAIVQATMFSFAAMFPPKYTQAIMAGNGWSGILVSLSRCFTKAVFPDTESGVRDGALIFFGLSSFITVVCVFTYIYLMKSEFTQYYFKDNKAADSKVTSSGSALLATDHTQSLNTTPSQHIMDAHAHPIDKELGYIEEEPVVDKKVVLQKIAPMAIAILATFTMTFLAFPGVVASLEPSFDMSKGWFTTILILIFNVFDLIGRSCGTATINKKVLQCIVWGRFVLYPLLLLSRGSSMSNSWYPIVFVALLGTTNGFASSSIMMIAPGLVESYERATSGGYMSMLLVAGILFGSTIALIVEKTT